METAALLPFPSEDEETSRILQGMISPAEAQRLVKPPPDSPPPSRPGESTPVTGSLAGKPSQAEPKRAPRARNSVLIRPGNGQAISEQTAMAYYRQANGDPQAAAAMAARDGWRF